MQFDHIKYSNFKSSGVLKSNHIKNLALDISTAEDPFMGSINPLLH